MTATALTPANLDLVYGIEPRFPAVLDSTTLAAFKLCHRKAFWEFILRRVGKGVNPHLNAGGAYATAHETFRKHYFLHGKPKDVCLTLGLKALTLHYGLTEPPSHPLSAAAKTWDRVASAFISYYDDYPPETDFLTPAFFPHEDGPHRPAIEFSFGVPIDLCNPQTGEPIIIGGKLDGFMRMGAPWTGHWQELENLPLYIYDDKSTYQMGPTWAEQWELRSQFSTYIWGAQQYGHPVSGLIIRGVGIQKTDIKHTQVIGSRAPWQIEEWFDVTLDTIRDMIRCWEERKWRKDLDSACTMYGGCGFRHLCQHKNVGDWLHQEFEERTWSPIDVESL